MSTLQEKERKIIEVTKIELNDQTVVTTGGGIVVNSDEKENEIIKLEKEINYENELIISINNVVSNFSVRCHLNLKQIASYGSNVEYHKTMAMLIMKLRTPRSTASIWSSGRIVMTGTTTELDAKQAARRVARILQKLGFNVKFTNYKIVNVLATVTMPFAIKIRELATSDPKGVSYEPELHPGATYRLQQLSATLKIFSTGSITITAPNISSIQSAVEIIYNKVYPYQKIRTENEQYPIAERKRRKLEQKLINNNKNGTKLIKLDVDDEVEFEMKTPIEFSEEDDDDDNCKNENDDDNCKNENNDED